MPIIIMNQIHNLIMIVEDVMTLYLPHLLRILRNESDSDRILRLKSTAGKVVRIQKMMLVDSLSAFEYYSQRYPKAQKLIISRINGRKYLTKIMEHSKIEGVIDKDQFERWEGIAKFRNCIVHNNSLAVSNEEFIYPGFKLSFVIDTTIASGPELYSQIMEWIIDASRDWIIAIENK